MDHRGTTPVIGVEIAVGLFQRSEVDHDVEFDQQYSR